MRIAITGASGFVGGALTAQLRAQGIAVVPLVRTANPPEGSSTWDPRGGSLDERHLGAVDAVVHLAGENVAGGRWSRARKQRIRDSRGPATAALCQGLLRLQQPPKVLVCASATGIYGDRGEELLDEGSAPGEGFLPEVARDWEAATRAASDAGIRVVNLRIGMVLDPTGGALGKMLLPFKLGLGGRLGNGRQWISWITRNDLVRAIEFALLTETLRGPALATTPRPVTNREFTAALGAALRRPTWFPAPATALRLLLGEMADALLLSSQRCRPGALTAAGFKFEQPEVREALVGMLGRDGTHDRAGRE
ncbi:MAG: TIGR01777 family protein [Planctomycetes bacterium]|nr:TIGR01777 family oxidoreductase [Planctomycetota bacterium]MCB9884236.1 TIGR01777 family protein [Planctomycetota bacterium]